MSADKPPAFHYEYRRLEGSTDGTCPFPPHVNDHDLYVYAVLKHFYSAGQSHDVRTGVFLSAAPRTVDYQVMAHDVNEDSTAAPTGVHHSVDSTPVELIGQIFDEGRVVPADMIVCFRLTAAAPKLDEVEIKSVSGAPLPVLDPYYFADSVLPEQQHSLH